MASAKILFGLLVLLLLHTSHADEQESVVLAPPKIPDYQFSELLNSSFGGRSQAIIGANSDGSKVYLLGGVGSTGPTTDNYIFDFTASAWANLTVNFTRAGACYAQASDITKRNGIWIFGGTPTGDQNNDPFTLFTFDPKFTNQTVPSPTLNKFGASCVASADGSKFYVMFGTPMAVEEDDDFDMVCPFEMGVYDSAAKTWTATAANGTGVPSGRHGAGIAAYKSGAVIFGGSCGGAVVDSDVYRLSFDTLVWTKDTLNTNSEAAPNVSDASVFVVDNSLFVVGGSQQRGDAQTYMYDLVNNNWTHLVFPQDSTLPARSKAAFVTLINRVYFYGGESEAGSPLSDAHQLVFENKCFGYKSCEDCSTLPPNSGCGWCDKNNDGFKCLAGVDVATPYIAASCNDTGSYVTDIDFCPQAFPSYAIALLVIGGVVVVGVIIFAIMKVRSGDGKQEYERIS